jgi:hypothetical protein
MFEALAFVVLPSITTTLVGFARDVKLKVSAPLEL